MPGIALAFVVAAFVAAVARIADSSAVISRASISTGPLPCIPSVFRLLLNSGDTEKVTGSSACAKTNTLATKSPDPPDAGWAWQPEQSLASGDEVRTNAG